jgi:hypothetical protein
MATTVQALGIPASENIVNVSVIDTSAYFKGPIKPFLSPQVGNLTLLDGICWSFLIENPRQKKKLVYDLGIRTRFAETAPPRLVDRATKVLGFSVTVERDVAKILSDGGVDLSTVDGIIWRFATSSGRQLIIFIATCIGIILEILRSFQRVQIL